MYGAALYQWLNDKKHANTLFFVWLEGHYICTGVTDRRIEDGNYTESDGHVSYYRADKELSDKTQMIAAHEGLLYVYRIVNGSFDLNLYDTQHIKGSIKTAQKEAYIWSRDGYIFTGEHIGGQFHYSSLVSGKKVRCAGMIRATNGKITRVDNDSGHYKPGTRHLRNFVQFLDMQNVFTSNATIEDKSTKPDTRMGYKEFLMVDLRTASEMRAEANRPQRIRWDLNRLNSKRTTLRDLVQKRFEAMRAEIGPAPSDHTLWTRAYKAICLDFAEIDSSWKRKANSPPIPRMKASRPE